MKNLQKKVDTLKLREQMTFIYVSRNSDPMEVKFGETREPDVDVYLKRKNTHGVVIRLDSWVAHNNEFLKNNRLELNVRDYPYYSDKDIHKFIKEFYSDKLLQVTNDSGKERFKIIDLEIRRAHDSGRFQLRDKLRDELINKIKNEFETGIPRTQNYSLKQEQLDCVSQTTKWYEKNGSFLLAAIPRFGKTITALTIARKLNAKNVYCITSRVQAKHSWKDPLQNHVDFDGWKYHDLADGIPILDGEHNFTFMSCQKLLASDRSENKYSIEFIEKNPPPNFVIIDEAHVGALTVNMKKRIYSLFPKGTKFLFVSGTPHKLELSGEYHVENTYNFTYDDEQRLRKERDLPLDSAPPLNFYNIEISDEHIDTFKNLFDEREMPCFRKIFQQKNKKNEWQYPAAVNAITDLLALFFEENNEFNTNINETSHHIMIRVDNVDPAKKYIETLQAHSFFKRYTIIDATGDGETCVNNAKQIINDPDCRRSIIITCSRWTEAVTIEKLGTVVFLSDMKSLPSYVQTLFRAKTPYPGKTSCSIIDFSLLRVLSVAYNDASVMVAKNHDMSTEEAFRTVLENRHVYTINGTKTVLRYTGDEQTSVTAFKIAREYVMSVDGIFDGSGVNEKNIDKLDDEELRQLESIELTGNASKKIEVTVHESGLNPGKTFESSQRPKNGTLPENDEFNRGTVLERYIHAAKEIEKGLFDVLLYSGGQPERSVNDLIITARKEPELFEKFTSVTPDLLESLFKKGVLDEKRIEEKIQRFAFIEDEIQACAKQGDVETAFQELMKLLEGIKRSSAMTRTPIDLVMTQLNQFPQNVIDNVATTICDPCCGTGTYLIGTIKLLMKSKTHIDAFPDPKKRLKNIVSRVHGFDVDPKQIFIAKRSLQRQCSLYGVELDYDDLNLYVEDMLKYDSNDMKFDIVIANPPYNGSKKLELAKQYEHVLNKGKQPTYYPFLAIICNLLKKDGLGIVITPDEFLRSTQASKLRNWLLNHYSLVYASCISNAFSDVNVRCAVTAWQNTPSIHHKVNVTKTGVVITHDSQIEESVFQKIQLKLQDFPPLKVWRGSLKQRGTVKHKYVHGYVKGKQELDIRVDYIESNEKTDLAMKSANENTRFVLFTEFMGNNHDAGWMCFVWPKGVVEPMPFHDTMCAISSDEPEKVMKLMRSPITRFYHSKLYTISHIGKSLSGVFPDITSLMSDDSTDEEICKIFGITQDEFQHISKLLSEIESS